MKTVRLSYLTKWDEENKMLVLPFSIWGEPGTGVTFRPEYVGVFSYTRWRVLEGYR
jgi:hypothetical protein